MGFAEQVYEKISDSLIKFAGQATDAILAILVILIFFAIGFIIAIIIGKIVEKIIKTSKIEKTLTRKEEFVVAGFPITDIVTFLIKVFVIFAFLGAATEIVQLGFITNVIAWITGYLPRLVEGVVVILGALILSDYVVKIIRKSKDIPVVNLTALVVQIFIAYVALVIALPLILPSVDVTILTQAFIWFVGACAIAIGVGLGIAMGLGLREPIAEAAKKHKATFEYLFKEAEKPLRVKKIS
jgi:hypothetical protein